jgi:transaldolase/fructose-6-phosphate aldolase-like protein
MKIKVFADCADLAQMVACNGPLVKGFTTNPSLMRKAGITSYYDFAHKVLQAIPDKPVSFEVFADNFHEMEQQARLHCWLGQQCLCKGSSDDDLSRVHWTSPAAAFAGWYQAERDGDHDLEAG